MDSRPTLQPGTIVVFRRDTRRADGRGGRRRGQWATVVHSDPNFTDVRWGPEHNLEGRERGEMSVPTSVLRLPGSDMEADR